jgi:guanylate kinase
MHPNPSLTPLWIMTAPSGAGKTTLLRRLLEQWPQLRFSVSCTTRPPRSGERHGVDYHFLSRDAFLAQVAVGSFLEHEEVHGHFYGTLAEPVRLWQKEGLTPVLDIDVKGALKVMTQDLHTRSVFVLPPSLEALRQRLVHRGKDDLATIERRLAVAAWEIQQATYFDYLILNDDLETAFGDLLAVVRASTCERARREDLVSAVLARV